MQSQAFVKITTLLFHQTYLSLRTLKVFIKMVAKNPRVTVKFIYHEIKCLQ